MIVELEHLCDTNTDIDTITDRLNHLLINSAQITFGNKSPSKASKNVTPKICRQAKHIYNKSIYGP